MSIIEAGDTVKHVPSGEQWFVLGVHKWWKELCVAGYPPTVAKVSDCVLVKKGNGITEKERKYREEAFGPNYVDSIDTKEVTTQ